ncbi:MAG TPA: hypothetical protein VFB78_18495 [Acidimicrobiales bacterium]|nr:hypothetical protein [Acidimicrobiales bacterium]
MTEPLSATECQTLAQNYLEESEKSRMNFEKRTVQVATAQVYALLAIAAAARESAT